MQEVYLTVDWERDVFNISQAVFDSPMPKTDIITIEPQNSTNLLPFEPHKNKLSAGAIAGIAIGAVFLVISVAMGWWIWRRKRSKAGTEKSQNLGSNEKGDAAEFAPEAVGSDLRGKNTTGTTELELEGALVVEMYARAQRSDEEIAEMQGGCGRVVEADGSAPVYELAGTEKRGGDA
jgi:hypothetical protein